MIPSDKRKAIQAIVGTTQDGVINVTPPGATLQAVIALATEPDPVATPPTPASGTQPTDGTILSGDGTWPFTATIVGDDIVVTNVTITCFGGNGDGTNSDPQDNGDTASGVNTNSRPWDGVSIAMDGRQFPSLSHGEHAALDGAPVPRMMSNGTTAWGVPVEVTIGDVTYTPVNGTLDLGPGKQASKPGDPHALDLTVTAVGHFSPDMPLHRRSIDFSATGSFRIIGGAKLI